MAVTSLNEVYKCSVCGNIVEVVHVGGGTLVCCGKEMILQIENSTDAATEKHVPVVERDGTKVAVKVGSVAHPMEAAHYIEWIELLVILPKTANAPEDTISYKHFFHPGDMPETEFEIPEEAEEVIARAYCNLHGLWKK